MEAHGPEFPCAGNSRAYSFGKVARMKVSVDPLYPDSTEAPEEAPMGFAENGRRRTDKCVWAGGWAVADRFGRRLRVGRLSSMLAVETKETSRTTLSHGAGSPSTPRHPPLVPCRGDNRLRLLLLSLVFYPPTFEYQTF